MKYSNDIWDYLVDMENLPGREDRDRLVSEAKSDPSKVKRVHLWDYFFRIDPQRVGRPQMQEIAGIEQELRSAREQFQREGQQRQLEIKGLEGSIERVSNELSQAAERIEIEVRDKVTRSRSRNTMLGIVPVALAGLSLLISIILAISAGHWGPMACGGVLLVVFGAIGAPFLVPLLGDREARISSLTLSEKGKQMPILESQRNQLSDNLKGLKANYQTNATGYNEYVRNSEARIGQLKNEIDSLVKQIPAPPSHKDVEAWLLEDIARLRQIAIDKTGLQDRLVTVSGTDNPICIHSPAELQDLARIPPPFLISGSNENKQLRARSFAFRPDGKFVDFYGIYSIDFVLIGTEVFGTYSTVWNFIRGEQMGEKHGPTYYKKITYTVQERGYRKIETENGPKEIYNSPLFTLNLESGERYAVAFPDLDYMRAINAPPFEEEDWGFDQSDAVENAMRAINERIRIAQGTD